MANFKLYRPEIDIYKKTFTVFPHLASQFFCLKFTDKRTGT